MNERYSTVAQHFTVTVEQADGAVTGITASYAVRANSKADLSGHYALRSNDHTLTAEQLWRTYITLTELESAFRSLKSELGLRPIYHQIDRRCRAHSPFISVRASRCWRINACILSAPNWRTKTSTSAGARCAKRWKNSAA